MVSFDSITRFEIISPLSNLLQALILVLLHLLLQLILVQILLESHRHFLGKLQRFLETLLHLLDLQHFLVIPSRLLEFHRFLKNLCHLLLLQQRLLGILFHRLQQRFLATRCRQQNRWLFLEIHCHRLVLLLVRQIVRFQHHRECFVWL